MLKRRDHLILEALLPSGAHPSLPFGVADTGFDAFWSESERTALPSWQRGFRAALWLATWFAPLLIRRPPPLTLYDRPTRERARRVEMCPVINANAKSIDQLAAKPSCDTARRERHKHRCEQTSDDARSHVPGRHRSERR